MAVPIFCDGGNGINTAIGCVDISSPTGFVQWILPKLLGLVGGISLLLMIYGGIVIITARGDAQKVKGGQETITSAITGVVFTILSLFILRLLGVEILKIPGLN